MKHKNTEDQCVVCGARARFFGDTCDSVCKRAKTTGRSRAGQIAAEIHAADRADRAEALASRFENHVALRYAPDDAPAYCNYASA